MNSSCSPISFVCRDRRVSSLILIGKAFVGNKLLTYLQKITRWVEKIKELLPSRFSIVFDDWPTSGMDYVRFLATYPPLNTIEYERRLFETSPMQNEATKNPKEYYDVFLCSLGF